MVRGEPRVEVLGDGPIGIRVHVRNFEVDVGHEDLEVVRHLVTIIVAPEAEEADVDAGANPVTPR